MPNAYIEKMADKKGKSVAELEKLWDKAKTLAADQGHSEEYDYITGIFKKMIGEHLTFKELSLILREETPTNVAAGVANPDNKMLGKKKCKCEDEEECECDKTNLLKRKDLEEESNIQTVKRTVPCPSCGGMHYFKIGHGVNPEWMCKNCTVTGSRQVRVRMPLESFSNIISVNESIDYYKTLDDVEPSLDKTLVTRISRSIGKNQIHSLDKNTKWYRLDSEIGIQLDKKLGKYSSGNWYRVGNKFLLRWIDRTGEWDVGI